MLGNSSINSFAKGSTLSYLNPADIENVTILKDADATAIYGSCAANGAILITTKKGKQEATKGGSVVFFNGYTLHSSLRNKTNDCFRTALVNHYMSAESMLPWDQDGHLPATEDLRDILMVGGVDPYAYKGIVDANKPYLRPEVLKIKTDL